MSWALGVAVVGGLCVSPLLTLFITPVINIYLDRIDHRLKRRLEPQADEIVKAAARGRGRVDFRLPHIRRLLKARAATPA